MKPLVSDAADHAGIFRIKEDSVEEYVKRFSPQLLRHNLKANSYGCDAMNYGIAKGLQFDRVLIVPTGRIKKYLQTGDLKHVEKSKEKLYVAVTRARHSVAFVFNGESPIVPALAPS